MKKYSVIALLFLLVPMVFTACINDDVIHLQPAAGVTLQVQHESGILFKGAFDQEITEFPEEFEATVEVYTNDKLYRSVTMVFIQVEQFFYEAASGLEVPYETPLYLKVKAVINGEYLEGISETVEIERDGDPYLIMIYLESPEEFEDWG